jgi:hypothetical protein
MVHFFFTHNSVPYFKGNILLFRCGSEKTHDSKIICTGHYWAHYNRYYKSYQLYYFTETFKVYLDAYNYLELVHIRIHTHHLLFISTSSYQEQTYLEGRRLLVSRRIFRSQRQGSQRHNMTERETFDYHIDYRTVNFPPIFKIISYILLLDSLQRRGNFGDTNVK